MSKKSNALKAIEQAGGVYLRDVMRGPSSTRECFVFELNGKEHTLDQSGRGATIQGFADAIARQTK